MNRPIDPAAGSETLLFGRADVERLLSPGACISAVEDAFRQHALGTVPAPGILGMHAKDGGFHIKAALLDPGRPYFAAKANANFPDNGARHGLPTIQGIVVLFDASNGVPLAIMDSMAITALRTAAATAVAARYLARKDSRTVLICGCGAQARAQLHALARVRDCTYVLAYDRDAARAREFAGALAGELGVAISPVEDVSEAVRSSDIVITCTTATSHFIDRAMVRPGTFIAAVGADSEHKQEIDPGLLAHATVVTDITAQCAEIGDLHHALAAGVMTRADVHAQLGEVVAGQRPGRLSEDEVIVFDSTGTALQDAAAAFAVYHGALADAAPARFAFGA